MDCLSKDIKLHIFYLIVHLLERSFLHKKMPVPSQEYDSCCPFVWCVCAFDFAIWLGTFRVEYFSEFSIFVFHFCLSMSELTNICSYSETWINLFEWIHCLLLSKLSSNTCSNTETYSLKMLVLCIKLIKSSCQKCLYQFRNMTVVFHSFDVFELLILPFDYGLSFLNFPWSSVFLRFSFFDVDTYYIQRTNRLMYNLCIVSTLCEARFHHFMNTIRDKMCDIYQYRIMQIQKHWWLREWYIIHIPG